MKNLSILGRSISLVHFIFNNEAGGVLDGYQIKLDIRQHGSSGDEASEIAASMLSGDNVIGVITSWSSRSKGVALGTGTT